MGTRRFNDIAFYFSLNHIVMLGMVVGLIISGLPGCGGGRAGTNSGNLRKFIFIAVDTFDAPQGGVSIAHLSTGVTTLTQEDGVSFLEIPVTEAALFEFRFRDLEHITDLGVFTGSTVEVLVEVTDKAIDVISVKDSADKGTDVAAQQDPLAGNASPSPVPPSTPTGGKPKKDKEAPPSDDPAPSPDDEDGLTNIGANGGETHSDETGGSQQAGTGGGGPELCPFGGCTGNPPPGGDGGDQKESGDDEGPLTGDDGDDPPPVANPGGSTGTGTGSGSGFGL